MNITLTESRTYRIETVTKDASIRLPNVLYRREIPDNRRVSIETVGVSA